MEILTKTGLDALWQKLKSSFILKKGGGTIVNNGADTSKWKDYKLGINHTGFGLRDDNDKFRIKMIPDEINVTGKTNDDGTTITDNTIVMPGITLTGDKGNADYRSSVRVGSSGANEYTYINREGIESYNGTNKEVYTRDGNYATIGDQPGNLVALDDDGKLPSAVGNFVPLDKASTISTADNNYRFGDTRLFISKYKDATYGDSGSFVSITPPTQDNIGDDLGQGELKMVNTYTIISPITNVMALTAKYLRFNYITNDGTYNENYTDINGGNITLDYSKGGAIQMWVQGMGDTPQPTIQLRNSVTNGITEYTTEGIHFYQKEGYLIGASQDFYKLNAANGVPQLDANGKLDPSVLPTSSSITDVQVNGTSVVSDGVANVTPQNLLNKTFDTSINSKHLGYSTGLYADNFFTRYDITDSFNTPVVEVQNNKVDGTTVGGLINVRKLSNISDQGANSEVTVKLDANTGQVTCNGVTANSGIKDESHVFNTNGGVTYLDEKYLPLTGGIINGGSIRINANYNVLWESSSGINGFITGGDRDYGASGEDIANLKISSWNGISFTTECPSQTYTKKTAIGMNCRTGDLFVGGQILAKGTISGNSTSDIRLKDNLKEADCISTINSLGDVYTFTYKDTKEDSIGLIAQNVKESSLADLVTENSEGYLGINYWSPKLVCLALGAAQQLDKRVKELEKQIEELKSK